jgi:hypothetical protein
LPPFGPGLQPDCGNELVQDADLQIMAMVSRDHKQPQFLGSVGMEKAQKFCIQFATNGD